MRSNTYRGRGLRRARGLAGMILAASLGLPGPAGALGPKSGQPPEARQNEGPKQGQDALLEKVGIDQQLGQTLPLDLEFTDSEGRVRRLGELLGERPVVLALVYYECPMLCTMVLNGLLKTMNVLEFDVGKEFDVVTVSIDPRETAMLAAEKKRMYIERYRREGAASGWHFLVGDAEPVSALAEAVGFRYAYDEETDQFAHGSAIMVVTPDGQLSRYFYGIKYSPVDLRLALVEAAKERIGSLTDAILLTCFQYDPLAGRYSFAIMQVIRIVGVLTVLALAAFVVLNLRKEPRHAPVRQPPVRG